MKRRIVRPAKEPCRVLRPVKAAANPNGTDASSPKFARHDLHLLGIWKANRGRSFPWYRPKGSA